MSDSPLGELILLARKKTERVGSDYTAHAKNCLCYVEMSRFSAGGTRERYSRCVEHVLR
jgi:hypothetical protein